MARPLDFLQDCEAEEPDAQSIQPEVWQLHKEEIRELYVGTNKPLKEIRRYMQTTHAFSATTKQWKDQLHRFPLKRYLNKSDAAHCLRLHRTIPDGYCRRVFFFGKEKPLADVLSYIRKSTSVNDEAGLLREIDQSEPPPAYITFEDIPPAPKLALPATIPMGTTLQSRPSSNVGVESSTHSPHIQSSSRTSLDSCQSNAQWQIINPSEYATREPSPLLPANNSPPDDGFDMEYEYNFTLDGSLPQPLQHSDNSFQPIVLGQEVLGPQNVLSVAQPFVYPDPTHTTAATSPYFHSLISITPPQHFLQIAATYPSWELSDFLNNILQHRNNYAQLNEDPQKDASTAGFFAHAINACILRNQGRTFEADREFVAAASDFVNVVEHQLDNCLTVISGLIALLESYGQRMGAREILRRVYQIFQESTKYSPAFTETLAFMCQTQIPQYGTSYKNYNIQNLEWVHREFYYLYGGRSRLTLTAHFNVAWALLEQNNFSGARHILLELKPLCETVFGPYHIQTIMAGATLARAHLYSEEHQSAEMMIKESVVSRIEAIFSDSHPYYWEAKFRQAAFMKIRSTKEPDPKTRTCLMQQSEKLLREVLIWRTTILGTANPRTNSTFRVLKGLLEAQGKIDEATGLYDWAVRECQPRRLQLYQADFALTW